MADSSREYAYIGWVFEIQDKVTATLNKIKGAMQGLFNTAGPGFARIETDSTKAGMALNKMGGTFSGVGEKLKSFMTDVGGLTKSFEALGAITSTITFAGIITSAARFQDAMNAVHKTVRLSRDEFAGLRQEILNLSKTLQEGPTAIAKRARPAMAMGPLGRAAMGDFVKFSLYGEKGLGMTQEEAGEAGDILLRQYGVKGKALLPELSAAREMQAYGMAPSKYFGLLGEARGSIGMGAAQLGINYTPEQALTAARGFVSGAAGAQAQGIRGVELSQNVLQNLASIQAGTKQASLLAMGEMSYGEYRSAMQRGDTNRILQAVVRGAANQLRAGTAQPEVLQGFGMGQTAVGDIAYAQRTGRIEDVIASMQQAGGAAERGHANIRQLEDDVERARSTFTEQLSKLVGAIEGLAVRIGAKATDILGMGGGAGASAVQGILGGELGTGGSLAATGMSALGGIATFKTLFGGRGGGGRAARGGMAGAQEMFMKGGGATRGTSRLGMKGLGLLGAGLEAYHAYSSEQDPMRGIGKAGMGVAGMWAGAKIGAGVGALFGGWGAIPGAIIGGGLGAWGGEELFNYFFSNQQKTAEGTQTANEALTAIQQAIVTAEGYKGRPSYTGVEGPWQVTGATGQEMFQRLGRSDKFDRFNPEHSEIAGKEYLKQNLEAFQGNVALAALGYNAGLPNVQQAVRAAGGTENIESVISHLQATGGKTSEEVQREAKGYLKRFASALGDGGQMSGGKTEVRDPEVVAAVKSLADRFDASVARLISEVRTNKTTSVSQAFSGG